MKHRPISGSFPGGWVRRIKQSLDLIAVKMVDESLVGLLRWDAQDAADLFDGGGNPVFKEVGEALDGRVGCSGM